MDSEAGSSVCLLNVRWGDELVHFTFIPFCTFPQNDTHQTQKCPDIVRVTINITLHRFKNRFPVCNALYFGDSLTFQRNGSLSSSRIKTKSSKIPIKADGKLSFFWLLAFSLTLKTEPTCSSKMLDSLCAMDRYNPEDCILHSPCRENSNPRNSKIFQNTLLLILSL
jgi:hypothetical protein